MESQEEGNLMIVKYVEGDIVHNLEQLASQPDFGSAVIVSGIGMLRDAIIGYFDGTHYQNHQVKGAAELVSLQGNIGRATDTGRAVCHLHAALATPDHCVVGGHLMAGTVTIVNEIMLYRLHETTISRHRNAQGLLELHLE